MDTIYQDLPENSFYKLFDLYKNAVWLKQRGRPIAVLKLWNKANTDSERELIVDLLMRFKYVQSDDLYEYENNLKEQIHSIY